MTLVKSRVTMPAYRKSHPAEMATSFYQLSRLLGAGVGMCDALEELGLSGGLRNRNNYWLSIARNVRSGKDLSEALTAVLTTLDNTIVALISAGEASGNLQQACQAVSEHLQWQHELRQRIVTILVYPLFSVCLLLLVTGFLFISVVPSIKGFLMSSNGSLDWHTHLLIDVSSWLSHYYLYVLIASACSIVCIVILVYSSQQARYLVDRILLEVPVIGRLIADLTLSRYTRCSAQLYSSGVSLERSMELAEATAGNRIIKAELCKARHLMIAGQSLAASTQMMSTMPAIVKRMIHIGESTGQLAEVLNTVGDQLGTAADASIKRLEQLIAPFILMFVGLVLLWIVVSVLGPVYNMAISTVMDAR